MTYREVVTMHKELPCAEKYHEATVGDRGVVRILYHEPQKGDDRHYCDVVFDDGDYIRYFDPDLVEGKNHFSIEDFEVVKNDD